MKSKVAILLLTVLFSSLMFKPAGALQQRRDVADFPVGTTIFVDGSNSSGVEDGTLSHPFNTIQEGISAAATGNTVGVAPGTYYEKIVLKDGVQLIGTDVASTIIDGQNSGTVVIMNNNSLLKGFTIQNGAEYFGAGIVTIGSPTITNNVIRNNTQYSGGAGAAIQGNNSSPIIIGNLIYGNTADTQFSAGAISFSNSSSPYIANNIIRNNSGRGAINLMLPTGNTPVVINNTIVNNVGAGIKIDMRVSQSTTLVINNIAFGNNIGIQMDFGSPVNLPVFKYNDIFGNTSNFVGMSDISGVDGNISVDPLLSNDFHLRYGSALIDKGSPTNYPAFDFDGDSRPLDGNGDGQAVPDIGADEHVYVDDIPPMITVTATTEDGTPYTAETWTNQTVTLRYTCIDAESGIASCPANQVFSSDGITLTTTGTAIDKAGNSTSVSFGPIKIDKTAPVFFIGVSPNLVLLNGSASLEKSALDRLSGIAPQSETCSSIDTKTVGTKAVSCSVSDYAGNQATSTALYQVIYKFEGFLSPVIDCVNNPCGSYQLSTYNVGSTVSLKFRLKDANGNLVLPPNAPLWLVPLRINGTLPVTFPEGYTFQVTGSTYTWRKSLNIYQYDWSTKKYPSSSNWLVGVKLDDGRTYYIFVNLK